MSKADKQHWKDLDEICLTLDEGMKELRAMIEKSSDKDFEELQSMLDDMPDPDSKMEGGN